MLGKWAVIGLMGAGLVAAPVFAKDKDEADEQHQSITMDQLPESVRNALQTEAKGNQIEELKKETGKNGKVAYEAEVVAGDKGTHLKLDESGKIVKRSTHSESKEKEHGKE